MPIRRTLLPEGWEDDLTINKVGWASCLLHSGCKRKDCILEAAGRAFVLAA